MLASLIAAFRLPDLRRRILFVMGMFAIFVAGLHVPVPNIDRQAMAALVKQGGALLGLFDVFSGGAFRRFSILAMSVTPYINASIIFQLLTMAWPRLEQLAKEGESGRKKIGQYTRYLTVILAIFQAAGLVVVLGRTVPPGATGPIVTTHNIGDIIGMVLTLTAGTCFLMWLGEQITDQGIGNGISLIIFGGIMARMPYDVRTTIKYMLAGAPGYGLGNVSLLVIIFLLTIAGIVLVQQGQRKIPIQHAKRVVGTRMYGGASTYLPLRVNMAGVIPIIFAISVVYLPATVAQFAPLPAKYQGIKDTIVSMFNPSGGEIPWTAITGSLIYFLLVVFFTYFYTAVTFNVPDVADNLKKSGSFIPGIRPGRPTAEYLDRVLSRITLAGALFLGIIALLQYWVPTITQIQTFTLVGGTSLLIVVGVALETMQQIEAHLLMRHYEGFIR
jgi:preprotein translocase subunit SecY